MEMAALMRSRLPLLFSLYLEVSALLKFTRLLVVLIGHCPLVSAILQASVLALAMVSLAMVSAFRTTFGAVASVPIKAGPTAPIVLSCFLRLACEALLTARWSRNPPFCNCFPPRPSAYGKGWHILSHSVGTLWLITHGSHQAQERCGCASMGLSAHAWKDQLEHFQSLPVFSAPAFLAHSV